MAQSKFKTHLEAACITLRHIISSFRDSILSAIELRKGDSAKKAWSLVESLDAVLKSKGFLKLEK
jgi:hypothetical protein